MKQKDIIDRLNEVIRKEDEVNEQEAVLYKKGEELRKQKANLVIQYFKEKNLLGSMTWTYDGTLANNKATLNAKEDWNKCPEEIVELLSPSYHDHFYFYPREEGIDEIEKDIKIGLHFSDGDISLTIEVKDDEKSEKIIEFMKEYKIKIDTKEIVEKLKKKRKEIEQREKVLEFMQRVNR